MTSVPADAAYVRRAFEAGDVEVLQLMALTNPGEPAWQVHSPVVCVRTAARCAAASIEFRRAGSQIEAEWYERLMHQTLRLAEWWTALESSSEAETSHAA